MNGTDMFGYLGATLIGISLGLIGGGGSILTVPVLVYLMGINPVLATAYSLFVVGISSLTGAIGYMKKRLISYRTALVFAIPSLIAVFLTRLYVVPAIPDKIATFGSFTLTKPIAMMLFFALVMLIAAIAMMVPGKDKKVPDEEKISFNYPFIMLEGLVVGALTGVVGAGGGFLIIPALVLFAKLPMKLAVGTSLLIIAAKSLIGFTGDLSTDQDINWLFLLTFTGLAVLGIMGGSYFSKYIPGQKLRKGFGWFVLAMSIYIFVKEIVIV